MTAVLFVGPTLYGVAASIPPELCVLPPAGAGDLLRAVLGGASRIGLVDGVFGQSRSVWHKEIVYALSRGVPVLGAASLGALRAAECAGCGMEPVGVIAGEYLSGRRHADADVAVLHAPAALGFRPLTVALVDAEDRIARLAAEAMLTRDEAACLTAAARSLPFTLRDWSAILAASGLGQARLGQIAPHLALSGPGRKARDALELTARLTQPLKRPRRTAAIITPHLRALVPGLPKSGP